MREQLAARQLTEGAIPDQVLSATDVDVENSSHSILGLAASAGNNHVGKSNVNTFAASYLNTQGLNNSCLKSPASSLVDLTFQSRALRSFSLNQLRNLSL